MASPASPRLPSPPPIPEDQLSPVSASPEQQKLFSNSLDHAAERRIRPGTKAEDMAEGPPLVDLSEIDSAFQLTEHLKALHNFLTHPIGANNMVPVDRDMAHKLAQAPENVDKTLWLYELCRFLTQKVNSIIVALFSDSPPCSSTTCPEMRASEWQYLCAVHDPPKSCCAIDYCCHTLDWAANTLTSPKHFPSRLALGTDSSTQHSQMRQLTNIFRRVYRIFAHAWFQHREMFWKVEGRTGLYIFFKTVCDVYGLIPEDNYTIPAEAEGIEPTSDTRSFQPPSILKREPSEPGPQDSEVSSSIEGLGEHGLSTAGTTKRHRHSPSVGASLVTTVVEENEEEDERPLEPPRSVTQLFEREAQDADTTVLESQESSKAEDVETSSEEPSSETAAATDLEKQPEETSVSEEKEADPVPQEMTEKEEVNSQNVAPEEESTDAPETSVSNAEDTEKEAPAAESKTTGEEDKAAAEEPEKAEKANPAVEADDKKDEDKE